MISSGTLWVRADELVHDNLGKREHIHLTDDDKVVLIGDGLQIIDSSEARKYHITGFESAQEAKVTKAILEGQALTKRHVNIKMSSD